MLLSIHDTATRGIVRSALDAGEAATDAGEAEVAADEGDVGVTWVDLPGAGSWTADARLNRGGRGGCSGHRGVLLVRVPCVERKCV